MPWYMCTVMNTHTHTCRFLISHITAWHSDTSPSTCQSLTLIGCAARRSRPRRSRQSSGATGSDWPILSTENGSRTAPRWCLSHTPVWGWSGNTGKEEKVKRWNIELWNEQTILDLCLCQSFPWRGQYWNTTQVQSQSSLFLYLPAYISFLNSFLASSWRVCSFSRQPSLVWGMSSFHSLHQSPFAPPHLTLIQIQPLWGDSWQFVPGLTWS